MTAGVGIRWLGRAARTILLATMTGTPAALGAPLPAPAPSPQAPVPKQPNGSQPQSLWSEFIKRAEDVLQGRQLVDVTEAGGTRGLRDVAQQAAIQQAELAVPLVIAQTDMGSSVVIRVDSDHAWAWLVTNQHVVDQPIRRNNKDYVFLLFYSPALVGPPFDKDQVGACKDHRATARCRAIFESFRDGEVIRTDKRRDLALLRVANPPANLKAVAQAQVGDVQPDDEVRFIGHPQGLLWSLSRGIVSQVRPDYAISPQGGGITVIQTDTAINPGSSGGPLLTTNLQLIGIAEGGALRPSTGSVDVPSPGLNFAIAVSEVQEFLNESAAQIR